MHTNAQWREGAPPDGISSAWLRIERPHPDHDPQISALLGVLDDGIWHEAADWRARDTLDPIEGEITHHIPYECPRVALATRSPCGPFSVYGDSDVADAHGHVATAENAGLAALICHALNAQTEQAADAGFYLVSFAHRSTGFVQFWRAENAGYTPYVEEAGIYRRVDIKPGYHDASDVVPVPQHIVKALSLRCIDRGRSSASIFSSPEALRAALVDGL